MCGVMCSGRNWPGDNSTRRTFDKELGVGVGFLQAVQRAKGVLDKKIWLWQPVLKSHSV